MNGNLNDETTFNQMILQKPICTKEKSYFLTQGKTIFSFHLNKGLFHAGEKLEVLVSIANDTSKTSQSIHCETIEEITLNMKEKKEVEKKILLSSFHPIVVTEYSKFETTLTIQLPDHLESVWENQYIIHRQYKLKFTYSIGGDQIESEIPFSIFNPNGSDHKIIEPKNQNISVKWMLDSESNNCKICQAQFTFFVRKHHCRLCGYIFCTSCCSKKHKIDQWGYDSPQRVCNDCYDILSNKK